MKNWKKLLVLFLALVTVFALAACNKEEPEETDPTLDPGDKDCEHVFTEWETTKENSCTKKGKQERECEKCGREEENVLLAFGHMFYGGTCSECGKEAKECEHPEVDTVLMSEATCTEDGEERKVCKLCKAAVDVDYISAFWHSETETVVVNEATCTENGLEQEVCKFCGEVIYERTLWATWHPETETVVVTEPTCTEKGLTQYVCKICGEVADEWTPNAKGHANEYVDAKNPTCTEIGWYRYRQCVVCGHLTGYEERPATGHSYSFGTCTACSEPDSSFTTIKAPGVVYNPLGVNKTEPVTHEALAAKIETFSGKIADMSTVDVYTFTAAVDGRYFIWLDDIYSGYSIRMYIKNALGETVDYDYYIANHEGIYMDLDAGTYTVELSYANGYSTYNIHIGHAKDLPDITNYDVVKDQMEYNRQTNKYTFTAAVSGVYFFYLSEMVDNAQMPMALYNRLDERIDYYGYITNGNGLKVTLEAGETYTLHIENAYNKVTPYTLNIGKQAATLTIDGYNTIPNAMTFNGQVHLYQFVATSTDCRIDVVNMISGMNVNIELYNYLNERKANYNYADNGEGFNYSELIPGQTYTVKVTQHSKHGDYTLRVLMPKAATAVQENVGVVDTIEYYGQANYYNITADASGEMIVTLRVDSYSNGRYVAFYAYDAQGNLIGSDTSVYSGDAIKLSNLVAGEVYILRVVYNGNTMEYAVSFT